MGERIQIGAGIILFIAVFAFLGATIHKVSTSGDEFKRGQIECINGNIEYELRKTDNNESKWMKIEEAE